MSEDAHSPGGKVRLALPLGMRGGAEWYGERQEYRPLLWREWGAPGAPFALFIGQNPSTADALVNDPTCAREVGFCIRWGLTAYRKCNISDYRATDPKALRSVADLRSPDNLPTILTQARDADRVVLAFGVLPHRMRALAEETVAALRGLGVTLWCLGVARDQSPRHSLYLRSDAPLIEWVGW